MRIMRIVIKWLLILIASVFLLLTISIEAYSFYKIHKVNPKIIESRNYYSTDILEMLWVEAGNDKPINIESFYVSEYIYKFLFLGIVFRNYDISPQGVNVSYGLARRIIDKQKINKKNWHEISLIISSWVSRNYDTNKAINAYLDNLYFGRKIFGFENASNYYFNKKSLELTYSEKITLIALIKAPSVFDPYCSQDKLIKWAETISQNLTSFDPIKYSGQKYMFPILFIHEDIQCNN